MIERYSLKRWAAGCHWKKSNKRFTTLKRNCWMVPTIIDCSLLLRI